MAPKKSTAFWYSHNKVTEALHLNSILFELLIIEILKLLNFPDSVSSTRILEKYYSAMHVEVHRSVPGTSAAKVLDCF